ncbi:hypothetical protein Efla_003495 [Eimeria flavescens]
MMDAEGPQGAPTGGPPSCLPAAGSFEGTNTSAAAGGVVEYTEQGVLDMFRCLCDPLTCLSSNSSGSSSSKTTAAANEYLTEFQRHPSSWGICISILNKHSQYQYQQQQQQQHVAAAPPEALHFAAQTLAAQARAGFPQQLSALLPAHAPHGVSKGASLEYQSPADAARVYRELRDGLLQLLFNLRDAPLPVVRQLCVALSAALIFGAAADEGGGEGAPGAGAQGPPPPLRPVLQALSAGEEACLPLLELLIVFPEELSSKRLALPEAQRLSCFRRCLGDSADEALQLTEAVFSLASRAHDAAAPTERARWRAVLHAAARALQSWVTAAHCWLQLLEGEEGGVAAAAPAAAAAAGGRGGEAAAALLHAVVKRLLTGGLFAALLKGIQADDFETLQLASECVVSVIAAASKLEETAAAAAAAAGGTGGGGAGSSSSSGSGSSSSGSSTRASSAAVRGASLKASSNPSAAAAAAAAGSEALMAEAQRDSRTLLVSIVEAYGDACAAALAAAETQQGGIAAFEAERLQAFSQGLTELAKAQLPRLLASLADTELLLEEGLYSSSRSSSSEGGGLLPFAAAAAADNICRLARALLRHPSFEVKETSVDFHRCLLNHMIALVEEERRLAAWIDHLRHEAAAAAAEGEGSDDPAAGATAAAPAAAAAAAAAAALRGVERRYEETLDALSLRGPLLSRQFAPFTEAAVEQLRPPAALLLQEQIEFEAWLSFRGEIGDTVVEAAALLDLARPCNAAAARLLQLLRDAQASTLSPSCMHACVEALLFFVSTVGNRVRLSLDPRDDPSRIAAADPAAATAAAAAAAGYGSDFQQQQHEDEEDACVLQLLQLLPRLPFPARPRQQEGLSSGVSEETLQETEIVSLFLHAAAARAIAWLSPRVVSAHQEAFAPLFSLLVSDSLPFVASLPEGRKDSNLSALRLTAEGIITEGVSSLVAGASAFFPSAGRDQDAGAEPQQQRRPRPVRRLRHFLPRRTPHPRPLIAAPSGTLLLLLLLQSLSSEVERSLSDGRCSSGSLKRKSVHPAEDFCPPPPSVSFEPLSPGSGFRHPFLDAVEGCWPTLERAMRQPQRSEFLYEVTCYAMVSVCGNCRAHVARYGFLYAFLQTLSSTFCEYPTVFHLGALRSLQGLFANAQELSLRQAVAAAVESCVGATLEAVRQQGDKYLYAQPDIVGISVDCVNVALLHPLSASMILSSDWFLLLCVFVIQFTPSCHHPKVLHTFMVFLSRLAAWVDPPALLHSYQIGEPIPWLTEAAEEAQGLVVSLLRRPFPSGVPAAAEGDSANSFLARAIAAVLVALTSVHAAPQSWIGSAAQTLLPLLRHELLGATTKKALEAAVRGLDPRIMDDERKREFCFRCSPQLSVRELCVLLQQTADDTKASYVRNKFAVGGPSRGPSTGPPPPTQAACL